MTNINKLRYRLAAIRRNTGYMGDRRVRIPGINEAIEHKTTGPALKGKELPIKFRDLATFHIRREFDIAKHKADSSYPFPKVMNLGTQIWGTDTGVEGVIQSARDAEQKFIEELGVEGYNKEMDKQIGHLTKIYGKDPYIYPDYLEDFSWVGRRHGVREEEFPGFKQHRMDLYNQERGTTGLDPDTEHVIDQAIEQETSVDDLRSMNVPDDVIKRIEEETER